MVTVLLHKDKKVTIITQQYEVGLYVAVYEEGNQIPVHQGGSLKKEVTYHKEIRKKNKEEFLPKESTEIK